MSDATPIPRKQESVQFVTVLFQKSANANDVHQADCDTIVDIGGLKDDLKKDLGAVNTQFWYHNGRLLENDRSLADYELDKSGEDYRIIVRRG